MGLFVLRGIMGLVKRIRCYGLLRGRDLGLSYAACALLGQGGAFLGIWRVELFLREYLLRGRGRIGRNGCALRRPSRTLNLLLANG